MYKSIDDLYPHNLISCAHEQNYLWAGSKDSKHNEASFFVDFDEFVVLTSCSDAYNSKSMIFVQCTILMLCTIRV